jgi:hypothetical protein
MLQNVYMRSIKVLKQAIPIADTVYKILWENVKPADGI